MQIWKPDLLLFLAWHSELSNTNTTDIKEVKKNIWDKKVIKEESGKVLWMVQKLLLA